MFLTDLYKTQYGVIASSLLSKKDKGVILSEAVGEVEESPLPGRFFTLFKMTSL